MNTSTWTERLSEYLDGSLTPAEAAECEVWLSQSADGRELLAELRKVMARAKTLPDVAVPESVWAGISSAIGQQTLGRSEIVSIDPKSSERPLSVVRSRRWQFSPTQLAAAAALLLAVGVGFGFWSRPKLTQTPGNGVTNGLVLTPAGNSITRRADESYDRAIADLVVILEHNSSNLDTATVRVLESSLAKIDIAIADAQKALDADPKSAYLNDHLSRIKRKKLDLLRQGASLARAS